MTDRITERNRSIIWGEDIGYNQPPQSTLRPENQPVITYQQENGSGFGLNMKLLSKNLLFLGETGSGKTNVICHGLECLLKTLTKDDVLFILDVKGDYADRFFDPQNPRHKILGGGKYNKCSVRWNIYEEIIWAARAGAQSDEEFYARVETYAYEIAKDLFYGRENVNQPFFHDAAEDLLACVLVHHIRKAIKIRDAYKLNNESLIDFFEKATTDDYLNMAKEEPDFIYLCSYLGKGNNLQALGVLGELNACIRRCLRDIFAEKMGYGGTFSASEAVQERGGCAYFIEYDIGTSSLGPVYRLIMDFALKNALSQQETLRGNVYLIFDELRVVEELNTLERALNLGRGLNVKIWGAIQSVSQLFTVYEEQKARAMLAGFANIIVFKSLCKESRAFIAERTGKCYEDVFYRIRGESVHVQREGNAIEDWDILSLKTGEAIVALADYKPFIFQFPLYV